MAKPPAVGWTARFAPVSDPFVGTSKTKKGHMYVLGCKQLASCPHFNVRMQDLEVRRVFSGESQEMHLNQLLTWHDGKAKH